MTYAEVTLALESIIAELEDVKSALPPGSATRSMLAIVGAMSKLQRAIDWMPDDVPAEEVRRP